MSEFEHQARDLLRRFPLIDGHNDLPWALRERAAGDASKVRLAPPGEVPGDPAEALGDPAEVPADPAEALGDPAEVRPRSPGTLRLLACLSRSTWPA